MNNEKHPIPPAHLKERHRYNAETNTHLIASLPRQPGQAGTIKIKRFWILIKQDTEGSSDGSCISQTIFKHWHLAPDR